MAEFAGFGHLKSHDILKQPVTLFLFVLRPGLLPSARRSFSFYFLYTCQRLSTRRIYHKKWVEIDVELPDD